MDRWGITCNLKSNKKTEYIRFAVPPISFAVTLGAIISIYFCAVVIFKTELFHLHDQSVLYVSALWEYKGACDFPVTVWISKW